MGIRCLFGHDFGDPETSREREERGDEVVVTVKEYKECRRCGRQRLLSENTEVTSAVDTEAEDDPGPGRASDREDTSASAGPATEEYEDVSAEEDDGVILEDEPEADAEGAREAGEWPEREDPDGPDDAAAAENGDEDVGRTDWPEAPGEDEGYSAEPGSPGPAEDVEFGGGLTPERAGPEEAGSGSDTEYVGRSEPESDPEPPTATGFEATGPSPDPTEPIGDSVDTDLVCARCGHLVRERADSFRPGDVCPECREGYLAEQVTDG